VVCVNTVLSVACVLTARAQSEDIRTLRCTCSTRAHDGSGGPGGHERLELQLQQILTRTLYLRLLTSRQLASSTRVAGYSIKRGLQQQLLQRQVFECLRHIEIILNACGASTHIKTRASWMWPRHQTPGSSSSPMHAVHLLGSWLRRAAVKAKRVTGRGRQASNQVGS
jgi:hypothetical protein